MYMFNRIDNRSIKDWAKNSLSSAQKEVWIAGVIIAVCSLLGGITKQETIYNEALQSYLELRTQTTFSAAITTFVAPILAVGSARFFLSFARGEGVRLEELAFGFFNYFKVFVATLLQSLVIALWSLLLIVPGVIKAISYSFVHQILAENPTIRANEALKISAVLTDGRKSELFSFYLSFFGWFLLEGVTLGIAGIYVQPLYLTAKSAVYDTFKADAIAQGRITEDVFTY